MTDDTERYAAEQLPGNYVSWRYCVEIKCGLALTPGVFKAHIAVLEDPHHEESQRFASLCGESYRKQVPAWFHRAATET